MLIQIILIIMGGIIAGTFTGLIPGIHINLIGVFLISLSTTAFSKINSIFLIIFITAMAITHTFLDFIPSIFLGCPDTDTELSVLPGHELLKTGHGYQATVLTAYGSIAAVFLLIIITLPAIKIIQNIYTTINLLIPYILLLISISLILMEKRKLSALFVFLLTGFLGIIILNPNQILGNSLTLNQPLLPLLTGLFGASMLIISIKNKTQIPEQKIIKPKIKFIKPLLGALVASPLCSFLPGLGSGQAAVIGNTIAKTDRKGFLFLLGATNTLVMGFSFISLYAISKTRTGAAVAIQEISHTLSGKLLLLILATILITGIISYFLTLFIAEIFSSKIPKLNYTVISSITLSILLIIIFLVSGLIGVVVLIASTLTGIYSISLNVKRTNMMGCLLIPTILIYLL